MSLLQELDFNNVKIRMQIIDEKPYFCASDICRVLGYANGPDAVSKHCKLDGIAKRDTMLSDGRMMPMLYLNEGNMYRLIIRSELPEAERFEHWVFDEVLPQIRQTGSYHSIPKTYKDALRELADTIEAKERAELQVKQATTILIAVTPKVEKYDQFLDAGNLISLDIAAKNIGIGRSRLTATLRDRKVFYKPAANSVNHVYQKYIDAKYFQIKMLPIHKNGQDTNYPQIYVTAKGMSFLQDMFKVSKEVVPISSSS